MSADNLAWLQQWYLSHCNGDWGNVICVQMVSGHPLIIGAAINSARQWKFRPFAMKGFARAFCGEVAIRFQANEYGVRYKLV